MNQEFSENTSIREKWSKFPWWGDFILGFILNSFFSGLLALVGFIFLSVSIYKILRKFRSHRIFRLLIAFICSLLLSSLFFHLFKN